MAVNSDLNIHNIIMCANMLVKKDGKFLFIRRSPLKQVAPNVLHIPGGKIDATEDPLQAAQRELWEEAGLKVKNPRLEAVVTDIHSITDSKYENDWLIFYFSGDYESGDVLKTEEGELVWLSPEEVDKANMYPSVQEIIEAMLDPNVGTVFARFFHDKEEKVTRKEISFCVK